MENETIETPAVETQGAGSQENASTSIYDSLSDEFKAHPSAEKFKEADVNTLFKSYLGAQSAIGKDKLVKPNWNDAEDVGRFWSELGTPESPEGYKFEKTELHEFAEGLGYEQGKMAELAHRARLTPDQARIMELGYLETVKADVLQQQEAEKERLGKAEQALRRELGSAFEEKMQMKDALIDKFARSDRSAQALKEAAIKDPEVAAVLSDIATQFAEHRIGDFKAKSFTFTPAEAESKISEIMKNPDYMSEDITVRGPLIEEVNRLQAMALGIK